MDLQSVVIRSYEQRNDPKPHVVYLIQVHTSTRDWTIRQRYSAFEELVGALTSETGGPPPGALPPKRTWMHPFGSASDDQSLEERRSGLERWLRGLVGAKDPRWRESRAFREFLAVPAGRRAAFVGAPGGGGSGGAEAASFTPRSWLVEQEALRSLAQDIRAQLARRDALASDPTQAHATSVAAKKSLAALVARLSALAKGLKDLSMGPAPGDGEPALSEGEMRRRGDMVSALQDECEALGRLSVASRSGPSALRSAPGSVRDEAPLLARRELLGGGGFNKPTSRVLGVKPPPVETPETRPLDNVGLLQLQQEAMDSQDDRLLGLAAILRRQRDIGMAINQELAQQNELLDDLSGQLDRTGAKLGHAKQQMRKLDGGK